MTWHDTRGFGVKPFRSYTPMRRWVRWFCDEFGATVSVRYPSGAVVWFDKNGRTEKP